MRFTIWNNAPTINEGAANSAEVILGWMEVLRDIILDIIIISGDAICHHMYMGRPGAHITPPYIMTRVTIVLNNYTLVQGHGSGPRGLLF